MKKSNNRKTLLRALCAVAIMLILFTATTAFAADDPVQMATDLVDIIFVIVRVVGVALLLFSIVQVGISLKNHDPSQRANAMMGVAGGIIIVLAKEIIAAIGVQL